MTVYIKTTYMKTLSDKVHIPIVTSEAQAAECTSDFDGLKEALFPVWQDTSRDPDFNNYSRADRAELLRLSGHYLNQAGRANKLIDHQLRAANLLTTASELFEIEGDKDKWADTQVLLANCYLYQGDVDTFDLFLTSITELFPLNHPSSIRINTHKIIALNEVGKYDETDPFLRAVHPVISKALPKLQIQFYDAVGITMCGLGEYSRGISHFEKELSISKATGDRHSFSLALNQLAMAHSRVRDFPVAHRYINEAISIATDGWLPRFLDTRAQILLAEGKLSQALESAKHAILQLTDSGDISGLVEAVFTKCRIELRTTGDTFAELRDIIRFELDEKTLKRYERLYTDEIEVVQREIETEKRRIYIVRTSEGIAYRIPPHGIQKVSRVELLIPGTKVLFEYENELKVGRVQYDEGCNLYLVGDDMLSPGEIKLIGVVKL